MLFALSFMRNRLGRLLDTAAVFRYHRARIKEFGTGSAGALGWHPEGQQVRFSVLTQIGDLTRRLVLDVGCGYADLYPYLRQHFTDVQYIGIEQMPELLDVARARYLHSPSITLRRDDFLRAPLPLSDYVLASGALNYRHRHPQFIYQAIEKLFAGCRLGLGFNLLSKEQVSGSSLIAYDPATIKAFCETLAPKVVLLDDYWEGDFTVFMYK
ncbi:MAG: class I SAM-dependent methyltransferase [Hymenobacter sp.]|nr:MAG: class I SAM-dependent methyltransferase [Hymenobacter sp.]